MPGDDYDEGGLLAPGWTEATNSSDRPEPVLTGEQWRRLRKVDEC